MSVVGVSDTAVPLPLGDGLAAAEGLAYPGPGERVVTSSGRVISARTAWRAANSVPAGTRAARRSRVRGYTAWCAERGRVPTDPGTLPDYLTHLADLHHPTSTLDAHLGTLSTWLELARHPLDGEDRRLAHAVVAHRAAAEARGGTEAAGALQATPVTPQDLAAMVATCDRTTVRGLRDAYALLLDWYMAGRCSEPAGLDRVHVVELTARYLDPVAGCQVVRPALEVRVPTDKVNPHGRLDHRVRILAQDTPELCPVTAHREWTRVLDEQRAGPGPLLRRVDRHGRVGGAGGRRPAGRPTADAERTLGISGRTVRNIIAAAAAGARLVEPWTPEQRRVLSTAAEAAALAALPAADRDEYRSRLRVERRTLRRTRPRYTGHSMRRGLIREMQQRRVLRATIEQHARYRPGSRALDRYLADLPPWADNPTALVRL
ncbi:hypothetical protein ACFVVA_37030 [Kitasatospora sp. NPDC058048]|uniref:hypothetical protein n=1 Tax=Kitasatospora sp. NPDC058048 TaxID=3346313 RepID=UPI0036DBC2D9